MDYGKLAAAAGNRTSTSAIGVDQNVSCHQNQQHPNRLMFAQQQQQQRSCAVELHQQNTYQQFQTNPMFDGGSSYGCQRAAGGSPWSRSGLFAQSSMSGVTPSMVTMPTTADRVVLNAAHQLFQQSKSPSGRFGGSAVVDAQSQGVGGGVGASSAGGGGGGGEAVYRLLQHRSMSAPVPVWRSPSSTSLVVVGESTGSSSAVGQCRQMAEGLPIYAAKLTSTTTRQTGGSDPPRPTTASTLMSSSGLTAAGSAATMATTRSISSVPMSLANIVVSIVTFIIFRLVWLFEFTVSPSC